MVSIKTALKFNHEGVDDPVFLEVRYGDADAGEERRAFFCVSKYDRRFERLVTSRGSDNRPLSKTTVIEQIARLRDDLVYKDINRQPSTSRNKHYNREAKSLLLSVEGSYGQVRAPGAYGVEGIWMNVLKDKPATSVWVEATEEVVQYFIDVVAAERDSGKHHRVAPRLLIEPSERIDDKGVCVSRATGHVRARHKDDTGKTINKFIKIKEQECKLGSLAEWVKRGTFCKSEVGDEGDTLAQPKDELLEEGDCKEELVRSPVRHTGV